MLQVSPTTLVSAPTETQPDIASPGSTGPTVGKVNLAHPDYAAVEKDWRRLAMLYEGGWQFRWDATSFLVRRPKEMAEVYSARVERVSYHNILGTCFGWYHASLFKQPPIIAMKVMDDQGVLTDDPVPDDQDVFYNQFRKDCDRRRTTLTELTRDLWTNLALFGRGWILLDVPDPGDMPADTLMEQKAAGMLDKSGKLMPHLVPYSPLSVINWSEDRYGVLEWAVLRTEETRGDFLGKRETVDCWLYFDRHEYRRYERVRKTEEVFLARVEGGESVTLVKQGKHSLDKYGIVPLMRFEVPSSLWLANRAYLPVVDHLNADNEYGWALKMSCLAMPVIISDEDIAPTLSEAGFIKLPAGSTYEWSEPTGNSFVHAARRVEELRQECYRLMYLVYQGRTANATADGASGLSKEMDMMPATDVMNEYGDVIVAATQLILDMVALSRGDDKIKSDVRGMKFGKTATLEQIQKTEAVLALAVPSDTFTKEVFMQAAANYLPDANPETLEKIYKEIKDSPSVVAQLQAMAAQRLQQYGDSIEGSLGQFQGPPQPPTPKTKNPSKRTERVVNE